MKKLAVPALAMVLAAAGCTVNLDLLGRPELEEVVLVKSRAREKILVVDVRGMIASADLGSPLDREGDIVSQVYTRLRKAGDDGLVRAVILKLDTPGGEVTASDILYREILRFKERTGLPVVGLMMGVAASGGYYVSAACDTVVAHPSTITGSIGVISVFPGIAGLFAKVGVEMRVIKSGSLKDAGSPFRGMSPEEQGIFEAIVNEMYEDFLKVVHGRRKEALSLDELRRLADGRVYTGLQALEHKLVDSVGYFDDALAAARRLAGLKEARVVAYPRHPRRQNNPYAVLAGEPGLFPEKTGWIEALPQLRAGFFYLWLPEVKSD